MAIGQNAGLYVNPIVPFQDPEDYMNMADSMDYFKTFGRAPDSVIESNEKARRKAELTAAIDKITSPEEKAVSEPVYGFKKLAEIAKKKSTPFPEWFGMSKQEQSQFLDSHPSHAVVVSPDGTKAFLEDHTGEMSKAQEDPLIKPDMHTNEAFAHYSALRDKLKKEIDDLKAELAFRQKVRKIKARMDPMWKAARIQAIFTGDMTPLTNLFKRYDDLEKAERDEKYRYAALDQTRDINEAAKKQESEAKKEANLRAANTARVFLEDAYDTFMANKASKTNQVQGRANLFRAYQDFKDKADAAGKDYNDFFADKTFMQNVDLELQEALAAMQSETEKKVANAKAAANVTALKNTVKSTVDSWNANTHTSKETNAEISRLKEAYPQFDFKMKGGKIEQNYNPKKGGKK